MVLWSKHRDGFLHPVLGQREHHWPSGKFIPTITTDLRAAAKQKDLRVLHVKAEFNVNVDAITRHIDNGDAACAVLVWCRHTAHRALLQADDTERYRVTATIPTDKLRGRVELHPLVLARRPLRLDVSEANPAYGNGECPVRPGAPLAAHPEKWTVIVDDDRPVRGLFTLAVDEQYGAGWHVDVDTARFDVVLYTGRATKDWFERQRQNSCSEECQCSIVWPEQTLYLAALTEALTVWLAERDPDSDSGWREGGWCATIEHLLAELGIEATAGDDSPSFVTAGENRSVAWVAQQLLRFPLQSRSGSE